MPKAEPVGPFDSDAGLLSIGALARALGIHPRTLRIYDQQKILTPKRSDGDRRLYSMNDYEKAKVVQFLTRNLALNLSGVKIILGMLDVAKVKSKDYQAFIEKAAKAASIDLDKQKENITKTSRRGRPAKAN